MQAFCKIPFTPKSLGADLISVSGHKIHAPKGVGALYIRRGLRLKPFVVGGSQEDGRRAGTEAVPQIAAFGAAAELASQHLTENMEHMAALKARTLDTLRGTIPELKWIETASPHILSVSLPGWRSEVLMNFLEAQEIYVSRSSASTAPCASVFAAITPTRMWTLSAPPSNRPATPWPTGRKTKGLPQNAIHPVIPSQ